MNLISINYCQVLADIDKLVTTILLNQVDLVTVKDELNRLYSAITSIYDDRILFTETIQLFIIKTSQLNNESECLYDGLFTQNCASNFVSEVLSQLPIYNQSLATFSSQELLNRESLTKYICELTVHYNRLLFVRVDLKYKTDCQGLISIDDFYKHIKKLRERMANGKSCFKDLQGFVWALEQGYDNGGLHCHLLLMYDGSKHQKAWGMAEKVANKWQEITEGYGTHFNCHGTDYINQFQVKGTLGIDMIHRNDEIQVANAIRTACYLTDPTKYSQRLKAQLPNMRTFGHGVYRNSKRRGLR